MNDPLVLLGDQLFEAARRIETGELCARPAVTPSMEPTARAHRAGSQVPRRRKHARVGAWPRWLRLPVIAFGALLVTTAIALAATGVILTGEPVRPEELQNPSVGEGLPTPGSSRLLALRAADPAGGLPWGMRILQTTRGELCVQVGRVQKGELGELGVNGAFHGDGRFHPTPAAALPADSFRGHVFGTPTMTSNTATCLPSGEAFVASHRGVDQNAVARPGTPRAPATDLRNLYYGVLGPQAVSVTYEIHGHAATLPVQPPVGAYLIVLPTPARVPSDLLAGIGSPGELVPAAPLTAITYRLDGTLCQRSPSEHGVTVRVAHPCPPAPSRPHPATQLLHEPIHTHVEVSHGLLTAVEVNFKAPFSVTNAAEAYVLEVPQALCTVHGVRSRNHIVGAAAEVDHLAEDVSARSQVTVRLPDPFGNPCEPRRRLHVQVWYENGTGSRTLVGSVQVTAPPGTRPG